MVIHQFEGVRVDVEDAEIIDSEGNSQPVKSIVIRCPTSGHVWVLPMTLPVRDEIVTKLTGGITIPTPIVKPGPRMDVPPGKPRRS